MNRDISKKENLLNLSLLKISNKETPLQMTSEISKDINKPIKLIKQNAMGLMNSVLGKITEIKSGLKQARDKFTECRKSANECRNELNGYRRDIRDYSCGLTDYTVSANKFFDELLESLDKEINSLCAA